MVQFCFGNTKPDSKADLLVASQQSVERCLTVFKNPLDIYIRTDYLKTSSNLILRARYTVCKNWTDRLVNLTNEGLAQPVLATETGTFYRMFSPPF